MIEMLRVDDRLIHGQIAMRWTKYLMVDSIILANDAAAADKVHQTVLKMACPKNIKLAIYGIDESIDLMLNPRLKDRKVLTIVNSLDDALAVLKAVPGIKRFNIGNYGKNVGDGAKRKLLHLCLTADEREIEVLKDLHKLGFPSDIQMIPDNDLITLEDILKKNNL